MTMHAKPREICWLSTSLLVPRENLLVFSNEFGFAMLKPFYVGSKRFVLVLMHSLIVSILYNALDPKAIMHRQIITDPPLSFTN